MDRLRRIHYEQIYFPDEFWEKVEGGGVNGSVFITNITPTDSGNVGGKIFSSNGVVLDECTVDTQLVRLHILSLPGHTNYNSTITVKGTQVTMNPQSDKPLFNGTIDIDLENAEEITVNHEDGASHTVIINQDTPPEILLGRFMGDYPGSQIELKAGDQFSFFFETDRPVTAVEFANHGAHAAISTSFSERTEHTLLLSIANRGNTRQLLGARFRVQSPTGSWSAWYETTDYGSEEKEHIVALNNQHPALVIVSVIYPSGQQALKNDEEATVNNTASHYTTITYSSPNSQLLISNTTTFEGAKVVQRISGDYNIGTNNFRISANRAENNATTTVNNVVRIAHVAPILSVNKPSRLRSGGNDETSAQNHTITIVSNQQLIQAPTLVAPIGNWQGGGFGGGPTNWTRSLQIHDDMEKGTYSWGDISGINLAGIEVEVITGSTNYVLGGFVSRQITLPAFAQTAVMNVAATNYANVALSWEVKALPNKRDVGTTATPDPDSWALDTLQTNPTTIRILDTQATNSTSQSSILTIEETI